MEQIHYQTGFRNSFESEALPESLPRGQNSPQKAPRGLYAEQLSGSAFTAPREDNLRTWLYRIFPSVKQSPFEPYEVSSFESSPLTSNQKEGPISPNQMRWDVYPYPEKPTSFFAGIKTYVVNGHAPSFQGMAAHLYAFNQSMEKEFFYNSDGEMLFVLQEGSLLFRTEMGLIEAKPKEIVVIPRGVKFQIVLKDKKARGYICENYGAPFRLPSLGPIGANGLANPRDFQTPTAFFEDKKDHYTLITKFQGHLWQSTLDHSPLNVVAWHGNYAPYKYNLENFNTINTVSFDHPDPSIFTVLTSPTDTAGVANIDFVIFPPRWMVAEHTFRPPYYHRNIMSEFMGLIEGVYDAKQEGFGPGGASLHNCMSSHGPDAETFKKALEEDLKPTRYKFTLAFMFESRFAFQPTNWALNSSLLQKDYHDCWNDLPYLFKK